MMRKKSSDPAGYLFGLPVLRPEWQSRQDDARQLEVEKTQALRAARLSAQTRAAKTLRKEVVAKHRDVAARCRARSTAE